MTTCKHEAGTLFRSLFASILLLLAGCSYECTHRVPTANDAGDPGADTGPDTGHDAGQDAGEVSPCPRIQEEISGTGCGLGCPFTESECPAETDRCLALIAGERSCANLDGLLHQPDCRCTP